MSEMSHEDFLRLLAEQDWAGAEPGSSPEELLPREAAAHAAACDDCARAAGALLLLASGDEALFDEPPASYWEGFDARLSARLEAARRPPAAAGPSARGQHWRVAAMLLLAGGLAAFALQGLQPAPPPPIAARAEPSPEPGVELDDLFAAWGATTSPPVSAESAAWLADGEAFPELIASPADSLHDELALELDEAESEELARLLRAEIAS